MDAIQAEVHGYVLREFLPGEDPGELTVETPLISGGVLDSIGTLKLVGYLEAHFGIVLEPHEADRDHLDSLRAIARLVGRKLAAA